MRPTPLTTMLLAACSIALYGCGLSRMADTLERSATWGNALPGWLEQARAVVLPADETLLMPAIEAAFAEERLIVAGTVEFEELTTT